MSITATMTQPDATPTRNRIRAVETEQSERSLIRALAAGDHGAAAELVERSYRQVYAGLARLCGGDAELAADLTQETFRRAWAGLARFDGRSRFSTWLFRIAYNAFLNHIRRPQLLVDLHEKTAQQVQAREPAADELLARQADRNQVRRAVLELPEALRVTVAARYWGELPVREVATMLGISEVAVRKRLRKALRMLGDALEVTP
jgi:RNA polymerase sigma-70 factor (ECF subfamily)